MSGPTRDQAARWLSRERWGSYLQAANNDHEAALALYQWNAGASASLLELLSYLEVLLRHRVDAVLAPLEVPASARLRADSGWWFASETFVERATVDAVRQSREQVDRAARERRGVGTRFDRARVLESLTFGTWTGLFGSSYEELWRQHLKDVFPHRPAGTMRKRVSTVLEDLRQLRNRIAHHEAIHELDLETSAGRALEVIGWMDPDACDWVSRAVHVREVLEARPAPPPRVAVVVAAGKAWPMYERVHAYVCQTARSFRHISHVAFYAHGAIQPEVAKVVDRRDGVPFSSQQVGKLMATGETDDRRLADVMKDAMRNGWDDPTYQVFMLTEAGDKGHSTLRAPITHQTGGRGSAWTQNHRYAAVADLELARTTRDLPARSAGPAAHIDLTMVDESPTGVGYGEAAAPTIDVDEEARRPPG